MAKSAYDLVNERFGVRTRTVINPEVATAEVADDIVLRANPNRYAFAFMNISAADVHLRPLASAAAGDVFVIVPNGSMTVTLEEDFTLAVLEWHVVGPAGAQAIFMLSIEGVPDSE